MQSDGIAKLLHVSEAAALLGVSTSRCYELVRRNIIPAVRIGRQVRFHPTTLERWLANGGQALEGGWKHAAS